ncbi:alcohol dehydrogenase, class IV [Sphaerochaeta pleomorpha str. Grapes]|uniref:Alcohol dehydrogenase, class IV n=1 Tax=Sphaerochaeta pleomorpha (strain ATCC BAA-1885 / DSM 22778 / Grapes) TaxID=158190 RepID=G8QVS3_SPHPG|nr:phosphonoacetaldehyde reductase [Sphaerochaeta pleomorpha]AEV29365.1 alcohol dehydrogenase, class IV [Sphaerochaeta pleomorpha str. Grapes]
MSAQTILVGDPSCLKLKTVLEGYRCKHFLLVCGSSFNSLAIARHFGDLGIPYSVFSSFGPNPRYEDVCKGVDFFCKEGCDCIVAVGGGSSIDVAKCIKLFSSMESGSLYLRQEYKENKVPLIALPTTAGTGSESTRYAVIYYKGEKQSVTHDSLVPSYAILEPSVLDGLPPYQKKCTMLDALCQAIESWWSVNSTPVSREYSQQAVALFLEHYNQYLLNTPQANEGMLLASNWAGRAINITQTTAPHAMSYKLTSVFKIPHGHAVAICLPLVWGYMVNNLDKCVDKRGQEYLNAIFEDISRMLCNGTPHEAISWFQSLLEKLDIQCPQSKDSKVLEMLVDSVNLERLKNSPVLLDSVGLAHIYGKIIIQEKYET